MRNKNGSRISISPFAPQAHPENLALLKQEVNLRRAGASLLTITSEIAGANGEVVIPTVCGMCGPGGPGGGCGIYAFVKNGRFTRVAGMDESQGRDICRHPARYGHDFDCL